MSVCCTHDCDDGRTCPERDRDPRRLPYHTGKVAIGIAHIPKPQPLTADQERMQAALLDRRTTAPQSVLQRLFGRIWSWL